MLRAGVCCAGWASQMGGQRKHERCAANWQLPQLANEFCPLIRLASPGQKHLGDQSTTLNSSVLHAKYLVDAR